MPRNMSFAMTTQQTRVAEHPILFSSEMVRAILENRKTMTRRVLNPQPVLERSPDDALSYWLFRSPTHPQRSAWKEGGEPFWTYCPYGQIRDHLWVRETLIAVPESAANGEPRGVWAYYKADKSPVPDNVTAYKTTPAIFMPRSLSRITLEITDVRVEKIQDITRADAEAEGFSEFTQDGGWFDARVTFAEGWDKLNAKRGYSWDMNPYVWVLEFKRIK